MRRYLLTSNKIDISLFIQISMWIKQYLKFVNNRLEVMKKLDVDPQRDDDASPMSTYRCMLRPT